jgi:hypothetical protein
VYRARNVARRSSADISQAVEYGVDFLQFRGVCDRIT